MPDEKQNVTIHPGNTWLGQNLPQYENLIAKLQELQTRNDALPADFNPKVFLQFIRGSVNEIKRLTAFNLALTEALKKDNDEKKLAFEDGRLVEK